MGALCLQAAALGLFLPETKGTQTLETMDDMNRGRGATLLVDHYAKADTNENESEL